MKKVVSMLIIILMLTCNFVYAGNEEYISITVSEADNINSIISRLDKGTILLQCGEYTITESINLKSNIKIKGNGATLINETGGDLFNIKGSFHEETIITHDIKAAALAGTYYFKVNVADPTGFNAGDIVEIKDNQGTEYNKIHHIEGNYIYLINRPIYFYKVSEDIKIKKVKLIENVTIEDLTIIQRDNSNDVFYIDYGRHINITNNIINGVKTSGHSVCVNNAEMVDIINNEFHSGNNAVNLEHNARRCKVNNNRMHNTWIGVMVAGHQNNILNNTIVGSGTNYGSGDGITVTGIASNNVISDNLIEGGDCYGIWITGTYPQNIILKGNIVRAGITTGIMITKGEGHVVTNNITEYNSHGIAVDGILEKIKNVVISNNISRNNVSSGIIVYSNNKSVLIQGNNVYDNGKSTSVYATDISIAFSDNVIVKDNLVGKDILDRQNGVNVQFINNIKVIQ